MGRKQKKYHYIYKTTNLINQKYYIGMHSTNNLEDGYLGSGKRLWHSIKYHGKDNHVKEILEFCHTRKKLKKREEEIVNKQLLNEDLCMNLKTGGEGGWHENAKKSFLEKMEDPNYRENHSKKMSESRKKDYENGKRERTYFYDWSGKNHSEETKKLLSKQRKGVYGLGENNSVYGRKWMNKDGVKKMVKKEEIEEHTNTGWIFGRRI